MEWHFRKSFSPIPGVRLTLSPSGITTSVEVGPIRITGSRNGSAFSASIPGTGLSFRQPLGSGHAPAPQHTPSFTAPVAENQVPVPMPPPASSSIGSLLPPMQHIRSAGSSALTSTGLAAFKETLETAQQQFAAVEHDLNDARKISTQNTSTYRRWGRRLAATSNPKAPLRSNSGKGRGKSSCSAGTRDSARVVSTAHPNRDARWRRKGLFSLRR